MDRFTKNKVMYDHPQGALKAVLHTGQLHNEREKHNTMEMKELTSWRPKISVKPLEEVQPHSPTPPSLFEPSEDVDFLGVFKWLEPIQLSNQFGLLEALHTTHPKNFEANFSRVTGESSLVGGGNQGLIHKMPRAC